MSRMKDAAIDKLNEGSMQSAQEIFAGNFTVWCIRRYTESFRTALQAEDLNLNASDIDENVRLGQKDMISEKDRRYLNQTSSQVQSFMRLIGAKRFFAPGLYSVPEKKLVACQEGLLKIQEDQKSRVEEFLERYDEVQKQQTDLHPNLANETWPTPEEVRQYFRITWRVFSVNAVETKPTDPEELIQAKVQFQKDLACAYEDLKDEILGQSYIEILNIVERLSDRVTSGDLIGEFSFKKPRAIIDEYLTVASIFDLPEVIEKVKAIKASIDTPAKDLRDKPKLAQKFAKTIQALGTELTELTGYSKDGRMKRTVAMDDDLS